MGRSTGGERPLRFIAPQLATLVDSVPAGADWLHEIKFDGYRIECLVQGKRARLLTRKGLDWTSRFPGVARAVAKLPVSRAILDGEMVALLPDGRSSFSALQERIHADPPGETTYFAFDLLHLDGRDLRPLSQVERKARLARLLGARWKSRKSAVRFSDRLAGAAGAVFERTCRRGLEGVVSKQADAPYRSGRTRAWLKTKCVNRQEFVVVGYTDPQGSRVGLGALLLAVRDRGGALRYVGRVGTGMSTALLGSLKKELARRRRSTPTVTLPPGVPRAGIHWVDPRLVVEVAFTEWTADGLLRHPALVGVREDKSPREVRREDPMSVAGIVLTNPDKVLYPEQGLTKQDLASYYEAIAPLMLPHAGGRPLSLVRCPEGTGKGCFFQKHWVNRLPEAVETVEIKEVGGARRPYTVVRNLAGLISLVQFGVLEFHVWGARADDVEHPDRIVFDLDPAPGLAWRRVVEGARALRSLLEEAGLDSWVKTTGGKGLHVVVPIVRRSGWEEVSGFARTVAEQMVRREPERYLAKASKAARKGKVFVDWLRNTRGATAIAPWSTRARAGAPVSTPISWEDLDRLKGGDQFPLAEAKKLAATRRTDPWRGLLAAKQRLTRAMLERWQA